MAYYASAYYGMNDFRNYSNSLAHFGRKGMKWGKSIFGTDEEWNRQRANSRIQRERFMNAKASSAAATKRMAGATKIWAKGAASDVKYGHYGDAKSKGVSALNTAKYTAKNAAKTAFYATAYAANVVEEKIVSGLRMGYKALKAAHGKTIEFGKKLIGKISGLFNKAKTKVGDTARHIKYKGKAVKVSDSERAEIEAAHKQAANKRATLARMKQTSSGNGPIYGRSGPNNQKKKNK